MASQPGQQRAAGRPPRAADRAGHRPAAPEAHRFPDLDKAELPADAIEVGRIHDAWGVKGWLKIIPHSTQPEALFSARQWYLQPSAEGVVRFSGTRKLYIREAREHGGAVVASVRDIDDRDSAEALRHARIFVPRSSFPSTASDEFYWVDLIGLDVVNREGLLLGQVAEIMSSAAQSVLVVRATPPADGGGSASEHLIPFVSAWVDGVDVAARRIAVDWQPDY